MKKVYICYLKNLSIWGRSGKPFVKSMRLWLKSYDALSNEYEVLNKEFNEEKKILLVENIQLKRKLSCMQDEHKAMSIEDSTEEM